MSMIISTLENGELCSHRVDSFFRYHDSELTEIAECGEVDCPLGHATLRQVDSGDIAAYVSTHGDPWASVGENLSPGWYIDVRDDSGMVWAFSYRGDGTMAEERARADFVTFERAYHKWAAEYDQAERNERRSEQ